MRLRAREGDGDACPVCDRVMYVGICVSRVVSIRVVLCGMLALFGSAVEGSEDE